MKVLPGLRDSFTNSTVILGRLPPEFSELATGGVTGTMMVRGLKTKNVNLALGYSEGYLVIGVV